MTTVKLNLADRAKSCAAWYIDKFGCKINSQRLRDIACGITDRLVDKHVPESIRAAGKMNCCITFTEIEY